MKDIDTTFIVALAGLGTTALAPIGQIGFSKRAERGALKASKRDDALADAVAHAQHLESEFDSLTDELGITRTESMDLPARDLITARLRLHAGPALKDWLAFVDSWDSLMWNAEQDSAGQAGKLPVIEWQSPDAKQFSEALRAFYSVAANLAAK